MATIIYAKELFREKDKRKQNQMISDIKEEIRKQDEWSSFVKMVTEEEPEKK